MDVLSQQPNNTAVKPSRSARMEPLAKLPVFWNLEGRDVLIIGGSEAAAWKAELVAAAGAVVEVLVGQDEPSHMMTELAASHDRIHLVNATWDTVDLCGYALIVADCASNAEAGRLRDAAKLAGAPVNIIDNPDHCDFQFGSIVNRSPVIVAISSDGAAPILAQAIRRRIETLLPPSLKDWAKLAQRLRKEVGLRLTPGTARRVFWERFVDMTFSDGRAPGPAEEARLRQSMGQLSALGDNLGGNLTLVECVAGDPDMLTLKAVRAMQSADVIVYDQTVGTNILELARREARRMLVSDSDDKPEASNDVVNALVRAGKRVVRLVGDTKRDAAPTNHDTPFSVRVGLAGYTSST